MTHQNRLGIWMGLVFIGLGILFLIGQFFNINVWRFVWPLMLVVAGGAFFAGMVSGGRAASGLAVPGSLFTTFGLILLVQSVFQNWVTWAYVWTLLVAAVGAGLLIMSYWGSQPDLRPVGRGLLIVGLVLFLFFGMFFELGALLLGRRDVGGLFLPVLLILAGLYVLFGRRLFRNLGPRLERGAQQVFSTEGGSAVVDSLPLEAANIGAVRRVSFRSLGDLSIIQGEREGMEIEAASPLRERVRADVRGDTLDLWINMDWWEWLNPVYWGPQPIRYRLYLRQLEGLKSSGAGRISVPQLLTPKFMLEQSGAGEVQIHGLETGQLTALLSGVGNTQVSGRATQQDVTISGVGSYQADRLQSDTAQVVLSGVGSASIWVTGTLDARLSGTGSIHYYGSPQVRQSRSGVGNIQALGTR